MRPLANFFRLLLLLVLLIGGAANRQPDLHRQSPKKALQAQKREVTRHYLVFQTEPRVTFLEQFEAQLKLNSYDKIKIY